MAKVLGSVQVKVTMHKYYSVPLFLDKGNVYTQLERMLENEEIPLSDEFEIDEEVVNAEMLNWAEADLGEEDFEDTDEDDGDDRCSGTSPQWRIFGMTGDCDGGANLSGV